MYKDELFFYCKYREMPQKEEKMYKDECIYEIFSKYGNPKNLSKQGYIELDKKQREDNSIKEYKDKQGRLHRENDLPAVIVDKKNKKYEKWYKHGFLHRENDKPAVIYGIGTKQGIKEWWYEGKKHRENDKPAVIYPYEKQWWYEGKLHRENDKPAVILTYKGKVKKEEWWYKGIRHRENYEPAIIETDIYGVIFKKEYFYKGKKQENGDMFFDIFKKLKKEYPNVPYKIEMYHYDEITGIETLDKNGEYYHSYNDAPSHISYYSGGSSGRELVFRWHKHGRLHRENDLPAVISERGNKEWWQDGELFREGDKPVIVGGHVEDENIRPKVDYVRKNGKFNI